MKSPSGEANANRFQIQLLSTAIRTGRSAIPFNSQVEHDIVVEIPK